MHQRAEVVHQLVQRPLIGVAEGGGEQAPATQGDGEPDVDAGAGHEGAVAPEAVELGKLGQRPGHGLDRRESIVLLLLFGLYLYLRLSGG